jgi:hypothetical protein
MIAKRGRLQERKEGRQNGRKELQGFRTSEAGGGGEGRIQILIRLWEVWLGERAAEVGAN